MLRLQPEARTEVLSRMHDQKHTEPTDTLHSVGEELSSSVSYTVK